jgi:hypothetical protein
MNQPIARYIDVSLEADIVLALRHAVESGVLLGASAVNATDYADALENDTYLMETTTPPDEAWEWPHINEQAADS